MLTLLPLLLTLTPAWGFNAADYTVNVGSLGNWTNPDDTPSNSFIDKDGQYYYQSAHSLYGKQDSRQWRFFSGNTIDDAVLAPASNAVNPKNPSDSNQDTTWRCNNSPTGLMATTSATSSYSQPNFCDLAGMWVDPDTGDWIGPVHNEFTGSPFGDGLHFDALDLAVSKDKGNTWTITDHIITSPYPTVRGDNATFPQSTYYWGNGDPRLIVDISAGYFYITYGSRIVDKGYGGGWHSFQSHIARAPMSGKLAKGTWSKYFNGQWSEPGIGGKESDLQPVSQEPTGYTPEAKSYKPSNLGTAKTQIANGLIPDTSKLFVMDVSWNAYLGLWIGEPQNPDQSGNAPQEIYATDDLTSQKWSLLGNTGSYTTGSWYRWFLDSVSRTSQQIVGRDFRAYCSFGCSGGHSKEFVNLSIQAKNPAQPVDTSKNYSISAGGQFLSLQSDGWGSSSAGGSGAAKWQFAAVGDGAYVLKDVASGKSFATGARYWGVRPAIQTPSSSSVAQQWWVIPNRDLSGKVTGTFRLINRYNGLALALSSNTGRLVEATPVRAWDDQGTGSGVGGGRLAAEQVLSFTVV